MGRWFNVAGTLSDYLIYPILELIKKEVAKQAAGGKVVIDPFSEEPSVELFRDHPLEQNKVTVTGARLTYPLGFVVEIFIGYTDPQNEQFPGYRVSYVKATWFYPDGQGQSTLVIRLHYDQRGLVTHTEVNTISL